MRVAISLSTQSRQTGPPPHELKKFREYSWEKEKKKDCLKKV